MIYDCTGFGTCATEDYIDVFGQEQLPSEPSEYIGSFLVRESPDTVPELGTIGLLGLEALGLSGRFRRVRQADPPLGVLASKKRRAAGRVATPCGRPKRRHRG